MNNVEFDKIVQLAKQRAVCPETQQLLENERPYTRAEDVRSLLLQTDAMAAHLLKNGTPRISSCEGADKAVSRAAKSGVLSMAELLLVRGALRNFAALAGWYLLGKEADERAGVLDDLFYTITPQPALERDIGDAILSDSEMADTASDALYDLRRKIRLAEESIRGKLDAVIKNPHNAKYLQDSLVSIRNGRFVVPVRAEHRGEIPGVIHDVSQSGGTFFVEPSAVVEANARIMQLRGQEQAEIERILEHFTARVGEIAPLFEAAWHAMLQLDMRLAKGELGLSMNGICPSINENMSFSLVRARHPLLNRDTVVPVDIRLGGEYDTLVVTGPNTGGKTVSLKTAGLLAIMAQTGYLLPAHDSTEICVFENVLADIGDEQSIEQSLSTFSGHMKNITGILAVANGKSLVLLDELGAGTDPAEGAALAVAIIERLRQSGALVMATTHYAEMKMFALETGGVQNAGSEFDVQTLRPTYRLLVGIPGRSNAFLIGEKLGLPASVIERARMHLSAEQRRFETVLTQLEDIKLAMKAQEEEIERLRYAAGHQLEEGREKRDALVRQGEAELEKARQEAKQLADKVQDTAFTLLDEMKRIEKDARLSAAQKAQRAREIARKDAEQLGKLAQAGQAGQPVAGIPLQSVQPGQEVWVPALGQNATVVAGPDKAGQVELRLGVAKAKVPMAELSQIPGRKPQSAPRRQMDAPGETSGDTGPRTTRTELNLLGKTVDEALMETDAFIDNAVMSGLQTVYIIHGRGTGALRSAITRHLKTVKSVKNHRLGRYGEGEDGVTVVELR